ncbi:paraben-hydrolyzing esterase precursor [Phaeosphaeria sp. MPI-PUGE-AT-0046c]|nr:paraben-hydrolyzing esterase precursor [Phaeosphaeria sp. MPI-PUGE-AT-0046c]
MSSKPSKPYPLDLQFRGHVEGLTYLDAASNPSCHFFGGVPYALPPLGQFRFQKPRSLPPCYRYGTKRNPARFTGGCGVCPQAAWGGKLDDRAWDEDCLQSNVWVPVGKAPEGGWPVLFWIHGGFLQLGTPNDLDPRSLLSSSSLKCILVAPSYRLNILGFLASSTLSSQPTCSANVGFWDQRLALQWTYENISYFGGNAANITVGGYSAGSHSVFHQLKYELDAVGEKKIIKRVMMLSNGPGLQPKSMDEAEAQYTELLDILAVPRTLAPAEQLSRLRALPAKALVKATQGMKMHQFRAATDSVFVQPDMLKALASGAFAAKLKARNIHIMLGECADEHFVYGTWYPPSSPGLQSLYERLCVDYPAIYVRAILAYYFPSATSTNTPALPKKFDNWQHAFSYIYASIQIHSLLRGLAQSLVSHGASHLLHRYRIEWRASCVDKKFPKAWGATHTSDMTIWMHGNGEDLSAQETKVIEEWLGPVASFVGGDGSGGWSAQGETRTLKENGNILMERDDEGREVEGRGVWDAVLAVKSRKAKL